MSDFYEPGHTYSDPNGWKFRVDTITTHPDDGERTALGWRYWTGWEPYAYGEDDWEVGQAVGWTVTAEPHGEKSSPSGAVATPGPTGRVAQLLDAIRTHGGRWTTTRAARMYRDNVRSLGGMQWSQVRTVARGDLRDLAAWGHLIRHEEPGRQFYTLKTREDGGR